MRLPIPPVFSTSSNGSTLDTSASKGDGGIEGVKEVLAGWVMRYLPPLQAVVLSFDHNPRFLYPSASFDANAVPFETHQEYSPAINGNGKSAGGIDEEERKRLEAGELVRLKTLPMIDGSGFTLADVEWKGLGWRPQVGMKLGMLSRSLDFSIKLTVPCEMDVVGTPTLSTSSHVSLLLHNLFNASIPSSHIPQDQYEFDPNCPVPSIVLERRQQQPKPQKSAQELELAAKKARREALGIEGDDAEDSDAEDEEEEKMEEEEEEEEYGEQGWWVDKQTRQPLGGQQGRIEFTLVA
jgi:hypothetical protein